MGRRTQLTRVLSGLLALATLVAGAWFAGCATSRVQTRLTLPPRTADLQQPQRIAVLPFKGPRGDQAQRELRAAVSRGRHHTLVDDRQEQERVRQMEAALASGAGGDLSALAPGGAAFLVWGTVLPEDFQVELKESDFEKCVKKDKKGKCTKKVPVKYYDLTETCAVEINGVAKRVADGQVVFDRNFRGFAVSSRGQEKSPPPSKRRDLCTSAFADAELGLTSFVTPYQASIELKFHDVDDPQGNTEKAVGLIKMSRLQEARSLFEGVIEVPELSDESRAWARYNLAVSLWTLADFDGCVTQIDQAQAVIGSDGDLVEMRQSCAEYVQ